MARYVVEPRGPFSLEAARGFLSEFGPAAHAAEPLAGHLHVAVVPDGSDVAGGACVRAGDGTVTIDTFGAADPDATRRQVERMLSLDVARAGSPRWPSAIPSSAGSAIATQAGGR